jgi:hypothetical protein
MNDEEEDVEEQEEHLDQDEEHFQTDMSEDEDAGEFETTLDTRQEVDDAFVIHRT